jgi:hypothetical protein
MAISLSAFAIEVPVGTVMPYYSPSAIGAGPHSPPVISGQVWEFCDGTNVAEASSPMFGLAKPDLMRVDTGAGANGTNRVPRGVDMSTSPTWGGGGQVLNGADTQGAVMPSHSHSVNDSGHSHPVSGSIFGTLGSPPGGLVEGGDNGSQSGSVVNWNASSASTGISINSAGGGSQPVNQAASSLAFIIRVL